jgi:hypothetical protein
MKGTGFSPYDSSAKAFGLQPLMDSFCLNSSLVQVFESDSILLKNSRTAHPSEAKARLFSALTYGLKPVPCNDSKFDIPLHARRCTLSMRPMG